MSAESVESDVIVTSPREERCQGDGDGGAIDEEEKPIEDARDEAPLFGDTRVRVALAQSQRVRLQHSSHLAYVAFQRRQSAAAAVCRLSRAGVARTRVVNRRSFRQPLALVVASTDFRIRFAVSRHPTGLADDGRTARRCTRQFVSGQLNLLVIFWVSSLAEP